MLEFYYFFRMEGAISPLEALVESTDRKVHLAAEDALRILAIRKEEEKVQVFSPKSYRELNVNWLFHKFMIYL